MLENGLRIELVRVLTFVPTMSTLAPASRRMGTTSLCPFAAASISAVRPYNSASTSGGGDIEALILATEREEERGKNARGPLTSLFISSM